MQKCIVFDLDETIGYFTQIFIICNKFEEFHKITIKETVIHSLFDYFNNIFTPGIFVLLAYIRVIKKTYTDIKVILYTNTILPSWWIKYINTYIDTKIHTYAFFDHIIDINTTTRTSIKKTVTDLHISCNIKSKNTYILYLDNIKHPIILHKNTTFIKMSKYKYLYPHYDIWYRLHYLHNIMNLPKINNNLISKTSNSKNISNAKHEIINIFPKLKLFIAL